jgi:polar amino acid transport system substrate-binding protein
MGDFTDRQQQVTFVDYLSVGEAALVQKVNAAKVTKIEDLAGLKVGASKGTIAATIGDQVNKQLEAEGLKPMQLSLFSGDAAGMLAVNSGQSFAHIMDLPFAAYSAAQTGAGDKYAVVLPNLLGAIPYGISVNKDNMALAQAIQAALNQMIADGSYQQILDKWGLGAGAVKQATINGGTTSAGG